MNSTKTLYVSASLTAVLAVSMIAIPAANALVVLTDATGDAADPNFDIKQVEINNKGEPSLTVVGDAGGTIPTDPTKVYAYVFFASDGSIYAVTSHEAEDSSEVPSDLKWHAHRVELDGSGCVTGLFEDGRANVVGDTVMVKGVSVSGIDAAAAVELTINGGVCVSGGFDST